MTSSDESLRFLSFRLDFNEHYRFDFKDSKTKTTYIKVYSIKSVSVETVIITVLILSGPIYQFYLNL